MNPNARETDEKPIVLSKIDRSGRLFGFTAHPAVCSPDVRDDHFSVLCPHAPAGFAGPVKIVPENHLFPLDVSLGEVSLVMNHMGLGAEKLLKSEGPINAK